jgi:MFS family permease
VTRVVSRAVGGPGEVAAWSEPRDDLVRERPVESSPTPVFEAAEGPFRHYRREVQVEPVADGQVSVTSTTTFELAVPYFGWLFALPARQGLRRPPATRRQPWWAPPDRLDPRTAEALGVLAAASLVTGYLATLLTQTVTYAAREFGVTDVGPQGRVLAAVRIGVVLALVLVAVADRRGRRPVILVCAVGGCLAAATGALAPSLAWLGASQVVARSFSTALAVLLGIVAAEEVPRGSRAYAVSVLGLAGGLGAGLCVAVLPLADLGTRGWRLVYLVPLAGLPLARGIARRLQETGRFAVSVARAGVPLRGNGRRLALLAASAFLLAVFTAPASQLQNEFLRDERGFSAARISLLTLLTNTPAGIGVVLGGRLADVRGRRLVGAVGLVGGVGATVLMFASAGWPLWAWSAVGAVVGGAVLPALGVYGPELFPTSLRGRANGVIGLLGVAGSVLGLLAAGHLADRLDGIGPALAVLSLGPAVLVVLVLAAYPETAHRELEELNPQDAPPAGSTPTPMPPPR